MAAAKPPIARETLAAAALPDAAVLCEVHDWARLDRLIQGRREALKRVDRLVRAFTDEDRRARSSEDQAVTRRAAARGAAERAEQAWAHAEQLREALAGDLLQWSSRLDAEIAAETGSGDRWVTGLPAPVRPPPCARSCGRSGSRSP